MNFEPKKERKKGSGSKNKSRKTSNQSYFSKWVSNNLRRFWEIKKNFNSWVGPDMTKKNKKNSVFTYIVERGWKTTQDMFQDYVR